MRRKHCKITDPQQIGRILDSANIGQLATNGADGYPYITPVNFVYYEGNIYFHCAAKGEKLDNIERDSRVCFEVDIPLAYVDAGFDPDRRVCKLHQFYHCVIIRGEARIVPDGPMKVAVLNLLVAKHEVSSNHELVHDQMRAYKACKVVEIQPKSVSAKSDLWQNKTAEERLVFAQYLKDRGHRGDSETIKEMGFDPENLA